MPQFTRQLKKTLDSSLFPSSDVPELIKRKTAKKVLEPRNMEMSVRALPCPPPYKVGETNKFLGAPFFKLSLVHVRVLVLKEGKLGGHQREL